MNWIHFSIWVAGLYLLYYLVIILLDVAGAKRAPAGTPSSGELTFSEAVQPKQLQHEPEPEAAPPHAKALPEIIASGGVRLKDFFHLAKQESIIYTRSVSFG
jgi:hypothetical protein